MTDITQEVIEAVVARVKSQVSDVSNRVFFEPPQKTQFPYIRFAFSVSDILMKDGNGQEFQFTFSTYTQRGAVGALTAATAIAKKIYDALDKYDLTLAVGNAFCCHWDGLSTAFTEEDNRTIQYVSRYKILTTNN